MIIKSLSCSGWLHYQDLMSLIKRIKVQKWQLKNQRILKKEKMSIKMMTLSIQEMTNNTLSVFNNLLMLQGNQIYQTIKDHPLERKRTLKAKALLRKP